MAKTTQIYFASVVLKAHNHIMKTIIAGGRNYRFTTEDLNKLYALKDQITEVVCGMCTGADLQGEQWAKRNGIKVREFKARWGQLGRKAGPLRNEEMARYADAVILFPGGKGTDSMASLAKKHKLTIFDYRKA